MTVFHSERFTVFRKMFGLALMNWKLVRIGGGGGVEVCCCPFVMVESIARLKLMIHRVLTSGLAWFRRLVGIFSFSQLLKILTTWLFFGAILEAPFRFSSARIEQRNFHFKCEYWCFSSSSIALIVCCCTVALPSFGDAGESLNAPFYYYYLFSLV